MYLTLLAIIGAITIVLLLFALIIFLGGILEDWLRRD